MAKKLEQYVADDGTVFETEAEADAHDAVSKQAAAIETFCKAHAEEAGKSERAANNLAKVIRKWEASKLTAPAKKK
jgi:hypothetical protein